jgi:hypothetical protein
MESEVLKAAARKMEHGTAWYKFNDAAEEKQLPSS